MRVVVISESFLPQVNGVTNSVCRLLDHLAANGHEALVMAPDPGPASYAGFPVVATPALALPFYRDFRAGLPSRLVLRTLQRFRPDIIHLASPAVLGASGIRAAARLGIPAVAVFQTDLVGFARQYGLRVAGPFIWRRLRAIHGAAARTLAPSSATLNELRANGIPRLARWGRGVDLTGFHPGRRSDPLRRELAPGGEVVVGYVGRVAADKRVHLLAGVADIPGVKLVVVGDGPAREALGKLIPHAVFTGLKTGPDLHELVASFDVFVHPGGNETFSQAVQEALASGVPVVAAAAGGPLDLVRDGRTGLLYKADEPAAMRGAVERLVADAESRRRMGEAARASVEDRTWNAVCAELLTHYREVLLESGRRDDLVLTDGQG
ncbi:glycosyltransferase family 1 protein [Herbidospora sp. NBRC 101105]|uniref:glycosyltransferase family 4 protein n=1 Tax=Herbidospora sp. NBRC 101105 TaxID=3032195 RepID=UPI0024A588B0|nr:glycosyltransferase family 1 protein [Herbidospora sp. NBRC 101105]GLX95326.1 GDP-mannose-dependent alpha-mannosyltransferase [Herbidospora sp. NBRC 101105]